MRALVTAPVAAIILAALAGPALAEPLKVGQAAPDFTVTSTTGGKHAPFNLKQELKKGPVVLYFYPAAFTPGCTIEAHLFADATADFKKHGAQVIGVSMDGLDKLDKFSTQECQGKFPLGADTDGKVAEAYGVKTSMMGRTIASRLLRHRQERQGEAGPRRPEPCRARQADPGGSGEIIPLVYPPALEEGLGDPSSLQPPVVAWVPGLALRGPRG